MPAPAGFEAALQRKYDIQATTADANAVLARAQAGATESRSPFENALLNAQAYQTNQQGRTLRPLADASIAATNAGIGETQARSGLYGAESSQIYDGLSPLGVLGSTALYRGMQNFSGPGSAPSASPSYGSPGGGSSASIASPTPSITAGGVGERSSFGDPNDPTNPYSSRFRRYAAGTPSVPQPAPPPAGPGPGQTITSGDWGTGGQNQALRAKLFGTPPKAFSTGTPNVRADTNLNRRAGISPTDYGGRFQDPRFDSMMPPAAPVYPGAERFAKGSAKVAHGKGKPKGGKGAAPMPMMPPGMMPPPGMPAPAQMQPAMPGGGPVAPPNMPPGLAGLLQAAMGASMVPGMPPPAGTPQDRVPAMLTPGEAVLTPGAAQAAGRGHIAALNAKHPPLPSGPARGAPRRPGAMNVKPKKAQAKPPGHTVNIHMKLGK